MDYRKAYKTFKNTVKKVARSGLEKAALGVLAVGTLAAAASGGVIYRTVPEKYNVGRGETIRMDVVADTTEPDVSSKAISSGNWMVVIPDELTHQSSSLPDPVNNPSTNTGDFFYNYLMYSNPGGAFNHVDHTTQLGGPLGWEQILTDNVRVTSIGGPTNVDDKVLGSYWFTVDPLAPLGENTFLSTGVIFSDSEGAQYKVSNGNLTIVNEKYNIIKSKAERADLDGDGDADGNDFLTFSVCFNGSLNPAQAACQNLDADMDLDGDVDGNDFLTWAICFNGSINPPKCD